jgi:hypothetical protein
VNSLDVFNSVTRERQSLTTFNWSFSTFWTNRHTQTWQKSQSCPWHCHQE